MDKNTLKDLFLKLTEFTIPYGHEEKLEKYLPNGFKRDSVGNYYYEIGNSDTLFTTHLDTYSKDYQKINHVIEGDIIRTDGKTILGGDNKLGCCILIAMIENKIPGTYFFFLGEEPIVSGGVWGSSNALKSNPSYFSKFKRAVAFDRREYGSVVTRQMARMCCSMEFATQLAGEINKNSGIQWDKKSNFGYYTDSGVFMDVIPECTNISAGGFHEHYTKEYVDLAYTHRIMQAALKVDWENLPVSRIIRENNTKQKYVDNKSMFKINNLFKKVIDVTRVVDLQKTKDFILDNTREGTFSKWLEDYDMNIVVYGSSINVSVSIDGKTSETKEYTFEQFVDMMIIDNWADILGTFNYYVEKKNEKSILKMANLLGFRSINDFYSKLTKLSENN